MLDTFQYKSDKLAALVPLLDLLNHDPELYSTSRGYNFNYETDTYEMVAAKKYLPGEEIVYSYGLKYQEEYLLQYGFIPEMKYFFIVVAINQTDPFYKQKHKIQYSRNEALKLSADLTPTSEVMNYLRVLLSDSYEVFNSLTLIREYLDGKLASPIDEIKSLNYILNLCSNLYNVTHPEVPDTKPIFLDPSEVTDHVRDVIEFRDKHRDLLRKITRSAILLKNNYIRLLHDEHIKYDEALQTNKYLEYWSSV